MAVTQTQQKITSYASGNVTTSAYTELFASTALQFSKIQILDTSGQILKIAVGPVGEELDICSTAVNGVVVVPCFIGIGSRISIRAVNANATTGYNVLSLIP